MKIKIKMEMTRMMMTKIQLENHADHRNQDQVQD